MAGFFFFFFRLLLLLLLPPPFLGAHVAVQGNPSKSLFLHCFLQETAASNDPSQLIYTPNTTSYDEVLLSSIQNIRFFSGNTTKPSFVILPSDPADVLAAVCCGRRHGIRLRVRSGGHDYEGQSYVSTGHDPFVVLDLSNLRSVLVDSAGGTAWVDAGATVGEVYYNVGVSSRTAAFPAGICPTIGVGGHFSGGGIGPLMRKYGLSADNIVDAVMVNAGGDILDRESMGEDVFWAIRGGGATSFGVVLSYKIRLVDVPRLVAVFTISRTLKQGAKALVERWQHVAPQLGEDLWIRILLTATDDEAEPGNRTISATFEGMYLGRRQELLREMERSFPELGLKAEDCREMSWVESTLYFGGLSDVENTTLLLNRERASNSSFKAKSDFVREPISEEGWEVIWKFMMEGKEEPVALILEPWGGRVSRIPATAIAFPHRKGNLYNIQYFLGWGQTEAAVTKGHLEWMRKLYEVMTPYVSSNPRAAYVNYKDIDLGSSEEEGKTGYEEASAWGRKYYLNNYERLARVKAEVDPDNYFWSEQSIPPLFAA